jgi:regulator of replication initiation timing
MDRTLNLVEKLLAMTANLTAEVTQLKVDNAVLKVQISELQDLLSAELCHMEAAARTMSSQPEVMSCNDALGIYQYQEREYIQNSRNITSNI